MSKEKQKISGVTSTSATQIMGALTSIGVAADTIPSITSSTTTAARAPTATQYEAEFTTRLPRGNCSSSSYPLSILDAFASYWPDTVAPTVLQH